MRILGDRGAGAWCVLCLMTLAALLGGPPRTQAQPHNGRVAETRTLTSLENGWRFLQDDGMTEEAALGSSAESWRSVSLPHTWNATDAATTDARVPYKRGRGWYRLVFDAPTSGARHWLQFDGASIVADVWLNGKKLGQHKGAFTAFRFDVTDGLQTKGNVLLVRTDNTAPKSESDPTAIAPLSGDFNMSGGLYRMVHLLSTASVVHVALDDLGGPGVYASTGLRREGLGDRRPRRGRVAGSCEGDRCQHAAPGALPARATHAAAGR